MTRAHNTHKTRALWLTGILHAFTHLYQVALMPLYLLIQKDFKFQSVGAATLLMTVLLVSCFGPSYPVGILADRCNRKHLLTFGLVLNALGFIGLALAPSYPWALAAVVVAGVGGSFYHPAATALIVRLFPEAAGKALGLVGIGAGAGFFLGPLYAGWRAGALESVLGPAAWRRPVLELGILGLVGAAVFGLLADHEQPAPVDAGKPAPAEKLFPTRALWFFFLAYCIAFTFRDFAGASMGSLGSLFLQKARGYDPQSTGLALSGIYLAAIISNPLFGSLSDRGRKRWLTIALVTSATMMAIFPWTPRSWTIPIYIVYGFFFLAGYPMTEAALMESVPDAVRGRVFGVFVGTGGVLGNLAHWVIGARVRQMGPAASHASAYYPLYGLLAFLVLMSLLGLLCLNPIRRREGIKPSMGAAEPIALIT
jgi:FSR family fosmidomycin resistance protein-like MFS transporter